MSLSLCDERGLIRKTNEYWRLDQRDAPDGKLAWYALHLLPKELECARQRGDRLPTEGCEVLALMLGFSFEPLMQALAAYKPQKVLMVVNDKYNVIEGGRTQEESGTTFYQRKFEYAFKLLAEHSLLDSRPEILPAPFSTLEAVAAEDDEPVMVFRFLRRHLLPLMQGDDGRARRTVIDITGAKKSMVAGAYLFATFANVPVSYVDFDYYDPEKGRPYGFTCKIGEMQSPSRKFRLREWERVRELYRRYAFRGATELLNSEILPAMEGYFDLDEIAAARKMAEVLAMYELWDNGDHSRAFEEAKRLIGENEEKLELLPTAITVLGSGGYWPQGDDAALLLTRLKEIEETGKKTDGTGADDHPILYLDMRRLVAYARDEMEKIKRLIEYKEDFRSALLRAVGLTEVLIKARLLVLLECDKVQVSGSNDPESFVDWEASDDEIKPWHDAIRIRIITQTQVYPLIGSLRYCTEGKSKYAKMCAPVEIKEPKRTFYLRRKEGETPLMPPEALLKGENTLRHKAIHTYLSIPPNIAKRVEQIARASVDDFAQNWAPLMRDCAAGTDNAPGEFCITRMMWQKLCDVCGVKFLPPRAEEEKEKVR